MFQINVKNTEIEIFYSGKYVYFRNFIYIDSSWPSILDFNLNLFTMKARTSSPLTFYSKFVHTTLWFHNGYHCCFNILHFKSKDWKTTQLMYCIQLVSFFRCISVTWLVLVSLSYLKAFLTLEQQKNYWNQFRNVSCFQAAICKFGVM